MSTLREALDALALWLTAPTPTELDAGLRTYAVGAAGESDVVEALRDLGYPVDAENDAAARVYQIAADLATHKARAEAGAVGGFRRELREALLVARDASDEEILDAVKNQAADEQRQARRADEATAARAQESEARCTATQALILLRTGVQSLLGFGGRACGVDDATLLRTLESVMRQAESDGEALAAAQNDLIRLRNGIYEILGDQVGQATFPDHTLLDMLRKRTPNECEARYDHVALVAAEREQETIHDMLDRVEVPDFDAASARVAYLLGQIAGRSK